MPPRLLLTAALAVVALGARPLLAADPEPVHFAYQAGPGCPSEEDFLVAVAVDGGLLRRAGAAVSARDFAVSLAAGPPATGRLVVRGLDDREAVRAIDGARCEDVAQSLAVLVALTLEPGPSPPPPSPRPPPPEPLPSRPSLPAASDDVAPPIERWRFGLSGEGTLAGGIANGVIPGAALYLEAAHDAHGPFAPAFRLGFEATVQSSTSQTASSSAGQISISRRVARADVCPLRFTDRSGESERALSADICARLDVGVLSATLPDGPSPTYPWVAPGTLLRIRWVLPPFFLDLEGGVAFPLVRERFHYDPSFTVLETPVAAGAGGIGVGAYFL